MKDEPKIEVFLAAEGALHADLSEHDTLIRKWQLNIALVMLAFCSCAFCLLFLAAHWWATGDLVSLLVAGMNVVSISMLCIDLRRRFVALRALQTSRRVIRELLDQRCS